MNTDQVSSLVTDHGLAVAIVIVGVCVFVGAGWAVYRQLFGEKHGILRMIANRHLGFVDAVEKQGDRMIEVVKTTTDMGTVHATNQVHHTANQLNMHRALEHHANALQDIANGINAETGRNVARHVEQIKRVLDN